MGCCQKSCKCCPKRNWIVAMVFFTTYINYTTRANQPMMMPAMVTRRKNHTVPECIILDESESHTYVPHDITLPDYGTRHDWDEMTQGYIMGSYFWGHVIGSCPSGFIAEWFGPHRTIFYAEVVSLIFNIVCPFVADIHWGVLVACRMVVGIMGGLIYPSLQVLIARWAPPQERGKFTGGLMGSNISTCVTWLLVGWITSEINWSWGYHIVSIQIAVFLVVFYFVSADSPDKHHCITEEERDFIISSQGETVTIQKAFPPLVKILLSVPFWALVIGLFGNLYGLYLQLNSVPKFLSEVIGFDLKTAGLLGATTQVSRTITGIFFGWFGDYLLKSNKMSKKYLRKTFTIMSHIIPGILLTLVWLAKCSKVWTLLLFAIGLAFNGASCVTVLINPQDLAPNYAGSLFGVVMMIGATTGFIAPQVTALFIRDHNGIDEWGYNFLLVGAIYGFSGVVFILFGSTEIQPWNEKKHPSKPAGSQD